MSKPESYFDWQLAFRKNSDQSKKKNMNKSYGSSKLKVNSLGISEKNFKEFMRKWKLENL